MKQLKTRYAPTGQPIYSPVAFIVFGVMQAIVLAAGSGIRLKPITDQIPKCMVEVKGKPLLEHVLTNMVGAGIDEINLVVGYKKEIIEDHFGPEFNGVKLNYFVQQEPNGTAHAVSLVHDYIKGKFLIGHADVIASTNDYRELVRASAYEDFEGLILARRVEDPWRFGVLKTERHRITDIIEKPNPGKEPSNLINAGIYRFNEGFFQILSSTPLSPRGEYEIVDAIKNFIATGNRVEFRMCQENCVDISSVEDLKAVDEMPQSEFPK